MALRLRPRIVWVVWYHGLGTEKNEKRKVAFQQRKDSKELIEKREVGI